MATRLTTKQLETAAAWRDALGVRTHAEAARRLEAHLDAAGEAQDWLTPMKGGDDLTASALAGAWQRMGYVVHLLTEARNLCRTAAGGRCEPCEGTGRGYSGACTFCVPGAREIRGLVSDMRDLRRHIR